MKTLDRLRQQQKAAEEAVLRRLEEHPDRSVAARDIARSAGLPSGAVRRAVWSLVERRDVQLTRGLRIRLPD